MQELVYLIMTDADIEAAMKTTIDERIPMVEITWPGQRPDYDKIMERPAPRLIKTHLYYKFFTKTVQSATPKFIVVSRDPKDCIVSYFHYYQGLGDYTGSFDDYFEMYKRKELVLGDPFDHAIGWLKHKGKDNFLFTTYKEMKEDILGVINKVAAFLNKELSDDVIEKIVHHTSFEKMKENPMVNKSHMAKNFIRKGIVGDWANFMSEERRAFVDSRAKEVQEKYGITF